MRTVTIVIALWLCCDAGAQDARRIALHGYASIGNGATYRGVLRSNPGLHWQAAFEAILRERAFAMVHVAESAFTTFSGDRTNGQTVDYSIGLRGPVGPSVRYDLRLRHSTFAQLADSIDYDYTQFDATLSWRERLVVHLGLYEDGAAFTGRGVAAEALWRVPWSGNELSIAVGGGRYFEPIVQGYGYWDAGISRVVRRVVLDLRYHYSPRTQPWVGRTPANGLWIFSVTAGF